MRAPMRVYMGWDAREEDAFALAAATLSDRSTIPVDLRGLRADTLRRYGLLTRPVKRLGKGRSMIISEGGPVRRYISRAGVLWDEISGAPMATEFAISRFLVPALAQTGWALFVDCDVLFLADIAELFALVDDRYALMCVQHAPLTSIGEKMDRQPQLPYARKNWSSVMLFNCSHPANRTLTVELVNKATGRWLHRFAWLADELIGALPPEWNWLVNVQPCPPSPKLAHFTLGGPWLSNWETRPYDDLWLSSEAHLGAGHRAGEPRGCKGSVSR